MYLTDITGKYIKYRRGKKNKLKMTPSPLELSKEIKKGNFLKPIRLKKFKKRSHIMI